MFTDQLLLFPAVKSPRSWTRQSQNKNNSSLDFEYQICNTFLKHTGERLHTKEAELICQTNDFLTYIAKNSTSMDKNITLQTANESGVLNPEELQQSQDEKYGSINRKKMNKLTAKRSEQNVNQALQQVKKNCSITSCVILQSLVEQYRKLQNRIKNIQSRQNMLVKKQQRADRYHEENFILKTKLQTQNNQIIYLNKQLHSLKQKNKQVLASVNDKIQQIKQNYKYQEMNNKVYRDIKSFLSDKQLYINSRLEKIQCIQSNIMSNLDNYFNNEDKQNFNNVCIKCCQIMKKIKLSIFNYKDYLQEQAQQMEKLYHKHKKNLFVTKQQNI